jgi:hypothetical protein
VGDQGTGDGVENTAVGAGALLSNTTGPVNTAIGAFALFNNTEGSANTATGHSALLFNTTGFNNTAIGAGALLENTDGVQNTATGGLALRNNTSGIDNTACGGFALSGNTIGDDNTATGFSALESNTEGNDNTANGFAALASNTTGSNNTALGVSAGSNLTTGNDNIDIGNFGVAGDSSTIRIGSEFQTRTFIAAIRGVTTGVADAVNVVIDSNGQLGTLSCSARFKKEIKPMEKASEAILALNPVTFHYKSDNSNTPQFGLIAEEVAAVNPGLVVRDEKGEIYTVRYDAVNAMLLNEFLKEHRKVQEQEATIAQLKKELQATTSHQQKQIEALTAGLQKVSAQLEVSKPAPKTVLNNQ